MPTCGRVGIHFTTMRPGPQPPTVTVCTQDLSGDPVPMLPIELKDSSPKDPCKVLAYVNHSLQQRTS